MRNASVLSKAGLLGSARADDAEKNYDEVHGSGRHSMLYGGDAENSPVSPIGGYGGHDRERRSSRPLVYDQRLNPAAIMQNWDHNGSRASVGTLQDQRDYSRPLNVTNPDLHG